LKHFEKMKQTRNVANNNLFGGLRVKGKILKGTLGRAWSDWIQHCRGYIKVF